MAVLDIRSSPAVFVLGYLLTPSSLSMATEDYMRDHTPLQAPSFPAVVPEAKHQLIQIIELGFPNIVSNLAMYSTAVITTLCISRLDRPDLLAAYGLGTLITNVFGLSIGVGLTSVLETLVAQAYGAGNLPLTALHLNRARLVVVFAFIPSFIFLWYTDSLLIMMGQDAQVAVQATEFSRWSLIGLLPFFLFSCATSFLRSCQRPQPPLVINMVASFIHLFVSIYFVNILEWELMGAGLSLALNNVIRFAMIELYFASKYSRDLPAHVWTENLCSFHGIRHFLGLALPSFLLVFIEWSCFELTAVIAGWVSTEALSAHVSGNSIIAVVYMIPAGWATAVSSLVGASIGEGKPTLARDFTKKGISLTLAMAILTSILIHYNCHEIGIIYTSDPVALDILKTLLHIITVFTIFDAVNSSEAGALRGLGKQSVGAKWQLVSMYGLMLPVGFALHYSYGVPGIWVGTVVGMATNATLFGLILWRTDYAECSRRAIHEARGGLHHSTSSLPLLDHEHKHPIKLSNP